MTKPVQVLDPAAGFKGDPTGATVLDFWQWSGSNLLDNLQRGVLAEFLVGRALGVVSELRAEWASHDLCYRGLKIDVKSAAYAQSWPQKWASAIGYGIARRSGSWDPKTNVWEELAPPQRTADIYVFALLRRPDEKDRRNPREHKPDPLDLDHWEFSVLDRATLDGERPEQRTIALNPLRRLVQASARGTVAAPYAQLKTAVDRACGATRRASAPDEALGG